jgi:hypothetical protein
VQIGVRTRNGILSTVRNYDFRFRKSLILSTVSFLPTVLPVIHARTPSTFAPSSAANSVLVIPSRTRTASTFFIRRRNFSRSALLRPGARHIKECRLAIFSIKVAWARSGPEAVSSGERNPRSLGAIKKLSKKQFFEKLCKISLFEL